MTKGKTQQMESYLSQRSSHIPCFVYRFILEMRCSQITENLSSRASGGKKLGLNLDLAGFLKGLIGLDGCESSDLTSQLGQSLPTPHAHKQP